MFVSSCEMCHERVSDPAALLIYFVIVLRNAIMWMVDDDMYVVLIGIDVSGWYRWRRSILTVVIGINGGD